MPIISAGCIISDRLMLEHSPTSTVLRACVMLLVALTVSRAEAADNARQLCELSDARISESSGLSASRRYPGHLWTHNDSGNSARLFLINLDGQTVATVNLEGASKIDWEDMAVAGTGQDAWVYVGDIGDNSKARPNIVVYRFREPELNVTAPPVTLSVPWEKMTLTYPDGANNAETLLATGDGHLIVITKNVGPSQVFKTTEPFAANTLQTLASIGQYNFCAADLRSCLATGGDLSPDGTHLVVRSYTDAYEWTLPAGILWTEIWSIAPQITLLPVTKQGESICYSADGEHLYMTSEQLPTPLWELTAEVAPPTGSVQFSATAYSGSEQSGSVTITVTRAGTDEAVTVQYATSNGTASAGTDYAATSGTLSWAAGDISAKTFSIPILNDSRYERNETVNLALGGLTGAAALGYPATAVLTILDDDPKISDFTPTSGTPGPPATLVTINGLRFTGATAVKFGGRSAGELVADINASNTGYQIVSDTQIKVRVPATAITGPLSVTVPSGTARKATFTVSSPTVVKFTPSSGRVSDIITITGNGASFDSTTYPPTAVTLNGVSAGAQVPDINASNTGYQVISATQIKVRVPAGAATGLIGVSNANGTGVSATTFGVLPSVAGLHQLRERSRIVWLGRSRASAKCELALPLFQT